MQIKSIIAFVALAFAGTAVAAPTHYNIIEARAVTGVTYLFCGDLNPANMRRKNQNECTNVKQPAAQASVQAVLDAAQHAGLPIPNGITVEVINNFHPSPHDGTKHATFIFSHPTLCPNSYQYGKTDLRQHTCVGHAYENPHPTHGSGTIFSGSLHLFENGHVTLPPH